MDWRLAKVRKGRHTLTAVARDSDGRTISARRIVRVCK
jgi:YD repeat-containing protein